jgi:hypothetical protein
MNTKLFEQKDATETKEAGLKSRIPDSSLPSRASVMNLILPGADGSNFGIRGQTSEDNTP